MKVGADAFGMNRPTNDKAATAAKKDRRVRLMTGFYRTLGAAGIITDKRVKFASHDWQRLASRNRAKSPISIGRHATSHSWPHFWQLKCAIPVGASVMILLGLRGVTTRNYTPVLFTSRGDGSKATSCVCL